MRVFTSFCRYEVVLSGDFIGQSAIEFYRRRCYSLRATIIRPSGTFSRHGREKVNTVHAARGLMASSLGPSARFCMRRS